MKLTRFFAAVLFFLSTATASAQFQVEWKVLTNEGASRAQVSNFASVREARNIIDEIISLMNLKVNFEVREANVPNAGAVFFNRKRYILYNPAFIKQIDRAAGTDWASISILAHEIGHHVKGHVFASNGGSSHQNELEADEFSGLVLRKMGASLEEAQVALRMIAGTRASATHPAKADRLVAIARGWDAGTPAAGRDDVARNRSAQAEQTTTSVSDRRSTPVVSREVAQRSLSRSAVMPDQDILVDVNFSIDRDNEYFITVDNKVVKWNGERLTVVGKLARLKNAEYPFYIYDSRKNYVLISKSGFLVNEKGNKVGHLSMHTSAATAAR